MMSGEWISRMMLRPHKQNAAAAAAPSFGLKQAAAKHSIATIKPASHSSPDVGSLSLTSAKADPGVVVKMKKEYVSSDVACKGLADAATDTLSIT